MPEAEVIDANLPAGGVKGAVNSGDFNDKADAFLDSLEQSSGSKDAMGNPIPPKEDTGADQSKKANLDEEVEKLSSEEEKLAKIAEILGDDEKAIEAYIKKMGYHKDPAWQKLLAKSKTPAIDEETQRQLAIVKELTSDPEFIRLSMKRQGYTDEAIDKTLKEKGFSVPAREMDDVSLVANALGVKPEQLDANTKAGISDVAKIADIIFKDRIAKALPSTIKPIEDSVTQIVQKDSAMKLLDTMEEIANNEKGTDDKPILDFKKDIEPLLHKFIDENTDEQGVCRATQQDLKAYFDQTFSRMTIDRLKMGRKQVDRNVKKEANRPNSGGRGGAEVKIPSKTGDFNTDADAILDAVGYHE